MKKLLLLLCAAMLTAGTAVVAQQPEPLDYPVYKLPQAPRMDGHPENDPAWRGVPMVTGFFRLTGGGYPVVKQSSLQIGWRDDAIYVAFKGEEPDIPNIKPKVGDNADVWATDSIEIHVQPPGAGSYYQFAVGTGGARRGATLAEGRLDWQAATSQDRQSYTVEVRLPFVIFGKIPSPGQSWRGNVARNVWTTASGGDLYTTWSPLHGGFNDLGNFNYWKFMPGPPDAEAPAAAAKINARFRNWLLQEIHNALQQGAVTYLPSLKEAAADPVYAARVKPLLAQWAQLQQAEAAGAGADVMQLRRLQPILAQLNQQSRQLKYQYLFEQLFAGTA